MALLLGDAKNQNLFSFDKNKYLGMFYLMREGNDILLINSLDIDDYLLRTFETPQRYRDQAGWTIPIVKIPAKGNAPAGV